MFQYTNIQLKKILHIKFINILLFITILCIPAYNIRISIANTSLSILTFCFITLSTVLFIFYYNHIPHLFKKHIILWYFVLFFIISFIPILFFYPTMHNFGIFIEWLFLPVFTCFFVLIYISEYPKIINLIYFSFTFTLFFVSILSFYYLSLNILTFDGRLQAFFLSPNHLAMFIAPIIFIVSAQLYTTENIFIKIFSFITILFALTTLYFTNSFNVIAAILLSIIVLMFIHIKKKWLFAIFVFIICLILFFIGYQKITHINPNWHRNSLSSRIMIWKSAILHLQNNSFISLDNTNNFQQIYLDNQKYFIPYLEWSAPTPHNLLLTLWIFGGFFSVLFFCLLCGRWLFIVLSSYQKTNSIILLLVVTSFLSILFSGFLDTPFWKNDLSTIFWFIIILGLAQYQNQSKKML